MDFDLNENNSSDNFLDFDLESIQTMEQNTELWGEDVLFIEDLNTIAIEDRPIMIFLLGCRTCFLQL